MTERKWLGREPTEAQRIAGDDVIALCHRETSREVFLHDIWHAMWDAAVDMSPENEHAKPGITAEDVIVMFLVLIEEIRENLPFEPQQKIRAMLREMADG